MSASSGSKNMRARNLDANRPVIVYYSEDFPAELTQDCAPISRAVHPFSSGMEKEEENESHLQEAILARQANTAGVAVENHVIPTPKVDPSSKTWYQKTYPPKPKPENLIRIQAGFGFDEELPEYDIDADDEDWLAQTYPIDPMEFERMIELLENASSENQICQPYQAKSLLSRFDEGTANDVYDYWLRKRKKAVETHHFALISHIRTEPKIGATGANPYIAFRRRAEKMQTRKNRKNDEESFEKILKLRLDTRRAVMLLDMIRQRERTKYALIDYQERIFQARAEIDECDNASGPTSVASTSYEYHKSDGVNKSPRKKRKSLRLSLNLENEAVNRLTLMKNEDMWNTISSVGISSPPPIPSTSSYDDPKALRTDLNSEFDGKYEFVRRSGCVYRAALSQQHDQEQICRSQHPAGPFYDVEVRNVHGKKMNVLGRSRHSRLGAVLDVLRDAPSLEGTSEIFQSNGYTIDNSRLYRARTPRSDEEMDASELDPKTQEL